MRAFCSTVRRLIFRQNGFIIRQRRKENYYGFIHHGKNGQKTERKGGADPKRACRKNLRHPARQYRNGKMAGDFPTFPSSNRWRQPLSVSVAELLSGNEAVNANRSANMLKSEIYVCPLCGNVIRTFGEASVCCCGVELPRQSAEQPDDCHAVTVENVEDEIFL